MPRKDPESRKAYAKARYAAKREELIAYQMARYAAKREELIAYQMARYAAKREELIAYQMARYAAGGQKRYALNPEKRRASQRVARATRRARKHDQFVETVNPTIVWDRDGGICHICLLPANVHDWHLEHIVPLARGGEHSYANTAVSHPTCNMRKGVK